MVEGGKTTTVKKLTYLIQPLFRIRPYIHTKFVLNKNTRRCTMAGSSQFNLPSLTLTLPPTTTTTPTLTTATTSTTTAATAGSTGLGSGIVAKPEISHLVPQHQLAVHAALQVLLGNQAARVIVGALGALEAGQVLDHDGLAFTFMVQRERAALRSDVCSSVRPSVGWLVGRLVSVCGLRKGFKLGGGGWGVRGWGEGYCPRWTTKAGHLVLFWRRSWCGGGACFVMVPS